ncbi:MAG: DNA methyltransferase [Candidatus Thorarchaeota archaeon]|jgi:DNA modification methylase
MEFKPMKLVKHEDYLKFCQKHRKVRIEKSEVELEGEWEIKNLSPPEDYEIERFNAWSFPDRGDWATHNGNYRGNWSPYIPRNLILRYTEEGDTVLDQMMGSGTTLVECKLLNRRAIGVDVNPNAVMVGRDRLNFNPYPPGQELDVPEMLTFEGDARFLNEIENESIDLVATHPPYTDIVSYSKQSPVGGDLSRTHNVNEYIDEIHKVALESLRVLKPGKHCGILMGDTRRKKHHVPIAIRVMQTFLDAGFVLREDIIKHQWKTKSGREKWRGKNYDFLLLAYEHLYIFRKPEPEEKASEYRDSTKWWNQSGSHFSTDR